MCTSMDVYVSCVCGDVRARARARKSSRNRIAVDASSRTRPYETGATIPVYTGGTACKYLFCRRRRIGRVLSVATPPAAPVGGVGGGQSDVFDTTRGPGGGWASWGCSTTCVDKIVFPDTLDALEFGYRYV